MIMEKTETTRKQIVCLTWKIRDIEEQMMAKDDSFLKVSINEHLQIFNMNSSEI